MQISSRNLDRVRKLKSQMTRLTARVQKVGSWHLYLSDIDINFLICVFIFISLFNRLNNI